MNQEPADTPTKSVRYNQCRTSLTLSARENRGFTGDPDFNQVIGEDLQRLVSRQINELLTELVNLRTKDTWLRNIIPIVRHKVDKEFEVIEKGAAAVQRGIQRSAQRLEEAKGKIVLEFHNGILRFHERRDEVGGYGVVRKAWVKMEGHPSVPVAMKVPNASSEEPETVRRRFEREGDIWSRLYHPNVNELVAIFQPSNKNYGEVIILSPWTDLGTATSFFHDDRGSNCHHTLSIIQDIITGVEYMHQVVSPVYHGDLKGNNVLIFGSRDSPSAKITDFGLSKICEPVPVAATVVGGNAFWTAPEVLVAKRRKDPGETKAELTWQADIWSLGMTIFELVTRSLFPMRDRDMYRAETFLKKPVAYIDAEINDYLQCIPEPLRGFLSGLLSADPALRPQMTEIKKTWNAMVDNILERPVRLNSRSWSDHVAQVSKPLCYYYSPTSGPDNLNQWSVWMNDRRVSRGRKSLDADDE
ncbi:kinase-like protein [Sistotremastrum suecicum HHB10207 ss-3]|uniref:Kinase-like protein n=1 Tax=Sistotremastrum suecicum HHB10207 ss-3 TaxID=1314776 RepID=A0A166FWM2_9AGAM|nr:kinase-like protein [Sistotremastrum suecicum HHB10207 ss-3]